METSLRVDNPWAGSPVYVRERVSSTMDDARGLALSGSPSGTVVVAGFQEKGRGRAPGRSWISRPWESLMATVVLGSSSLRFPSAQLPLRAAVAACLAVEEASGLSLQIKWPNDLVHAGRKLCGILCEACGSVFLVGIGINCSQRDFPSELSTHVCSILQASGREVAPLALLPLVLGRLKAVIEDAQWREKLQERLAFRGTSVRLFRLNGSPYAEGIVRGVDEEGRLLLVDDNGVIAAVSAGEITSGS